MAERDGTSGAAWVQTALPKLPGLFGGTAAFSQWPNGSPEPEVTIPTFGFGPRAATAAPAPITPAATERQGTNGESVILGGEWFDKIHILPRTEVEFGQIITQVEETFEIYNAYRRATFALSNITNNVTPGVTLPDKAPPDQVAPQTSFKRDTSTPNDAGTGLGTVVLTRVVAETEGLPLFDGSVVFTFVDVAATITPNTVSLRISGSRIVLLPFEYERPCDEVLEELTDIATTLSGKEQRAAMRPTSRQLFSFRYALLDEERQQMQALLFHQTDKVFALPLWHERVLTTADAAVGVTQLSTVGASEVDFRVGALAVVLTDRLTFDVLTVTAVTDTLVTFSNPTLNAYAAGTAIMPVRTTHVIGDVNSARKLVNLETFNLSFRSTDNTTGAPAGNTALGSWTTYNGRVLFDDCDVMFSDERGSEFRRRIYQVDNDVGEEVSRVSPWDTGKKGTVKGFLARNRAQIRALRLLWLGVRGRQKAFYIPTAIEDVTIVGDISPSDNAVVISDIQYGRLFQNRSPANIIHIMFTDGTDLVRTVTGSSDLGATEQLTVDSALGVTKTAAEVERVEFYELVRFDSDRMRVRYLRIGLATTELPIVRVFDDR